MRIPGPGGIGQSSTPAPTLLHSAGAYQGGGSTNAVTITSTTAGNTLLVFHWDPNTNAPTQQATVADNKSGGSSTYTDLASLCNGTYSTGQCTGTASTGRMDLFCTSNIASGITQVTSTFYFANATDTVLEISGTPAVSGCTSSVIDQFIGARSGYTVSTWSTGSTGSTGQANELAVGGAVDFRSTSQTFTPGSGWTSITTINGSGSLAMFTEYDSLSAIGTIAATGGNTNTSNSQIDAIVVTLK